MRPDLFARYIDPHFRTDWRYIQVLAHEISQRIAARSTGTARHLIVSMPPRHGKSELASSYAPVWALNNNPRLRIGFASYGARLARGFGRRMRNIAHENRAKLKLRVADDSAAADEWMTTGGGGVFTSGVGGSFTGKGFDLLLIDDPVKNWTDAFSQIKRDALWEWFQSTAWTRLEPGGVCIVVMTRWHSDDLVGRILADPDIAPDFDVIALPALAEENDPLGRAIGEALCPDRYPVDRLLKIKSIVGPMVWAGLYQQQPYAKGGGMFPADAWQLYDSPPDRFDQVIASWDMAFEETRSSDYVVGQVWGKAGAAAYLLEQVRDRMAFVKTKDALRSQYERWRGRGLTSIYVEKAANGPAVMNALESEVPGLCGVRPDGSKEARAAAVSPFVAAGNVHLPKWQSWVQDFVAEHEAFPAGDHDDQVDATSQALRQLYLGGSLLVDIAPDESLVRPSPWASPR